MPTVIISEPTFAKLKQISEPFVDTPESRIERLIDDELMRRGVPSNGNAHAPTIKEGIISQDPMSHDSLFHTRIISATIGGKELYRPNWNGLLDYLHVLALKHLGSFDALKRASASQIRQGRYEQLGFGYVPDGDISIQGVDANMAWDHSLRLARTIEVPIKLIFEWREKEGAAHPGKRGALEWAPAK
jgi:hypothetical protein